MLKANANNAQAHLLKGQLLLLEGKGEDALAEFRLATAADPSLPDPSSLSAAYTRLAATTRPRNLRFAKSFV